MRAKLIKTGSDYLLRDMNSEVLAITNGTTEGRKLSKQNCDEIFGVVDVVRLAHKFADKFYNDAVPQRFASYIIGFNKAMELNKDKVFTLEDMEKAFDYGYGYADEKLINRTDDEECENTFEKLIQSIQQPTEIEVTFNLDEKDSEGCLILKKI